MQGERLRGKRVWYRRWRCVGAQHSLLSIICDCLSRYNIWGGGMMETINLFEVIYIFLTKIVTDNNKARHWNNLSMEFGCQKYSVPNTLMCFNSNMLGDDVIMSELSENTNVLNTCSYSIYLSIAVMRTDERLSQPVQIFTSRNIYNRCRVKMKKKKYRDVSRNWFSNDDSSYRSNSLYRPLK